MKLMILNPGEKGPTGYEFVYMTGVDVNLDHISDNECEEISVQNCFASLPLEASIGFLTALSCKLRRGGLLRFNGVDARMLCRALIKGKMNDQDFNTIVYSCRSLLSVPTVKEIIRRSGLQIETLTLNGFNYDVTATR